MNILETLIAIEHRPESALIPEGGLVIHSCTNGRREELRLAKTGNTVRPIVVITGRDQTELVDVNYATDETRAALAAPGHVLDIDPQIFELKLMESILSAN